MRDEGKGAVNEAMSEAARLPGLVDAFVFRRVSATRWAHLGGLGRGRGWAGLVDVEDGSEPLLGDVPLRTGDLLVRRHDAPQRVLGPYFARAAALVRVQDDMVVVLGSPLLPLPEDVDEALIKRFALWVESTLEDIRPSKMLGDELELLQAVKAAAAVGMGTLEDTRRHLLRVAMESLSCEVGILSDGAGGLVLKTSWPAAHIEVEQAREILAELDQLGGNELMSFQDTATPSTPASLRAWSGVRAVLAVPIPQPVGGTLLLGHTDACPRGFTALCQQLGIQLAEVASVVVQTAAIREQLETAVSELRVTARRDALTGLGNRLAWDEALEAAQRRIDAGGTATVVSLDVDGLKEVNDNCGHAAGDGLLQRCAEVLVRHSRPGDVCVRLGGDEFALILPIDAGVAADRAEALRRAVDHGTSCDLRVAASVGWATVVAGGSIADAAREADAAMYAEKRSRRQAYADSLLLTAQADLAAVAHDLAVAHPGGGGVDRLHEDRDERVGL